MTRGDPEPTWSEVFAAMTVTRIRERLAEAEPEPELIAALGRDRRATVRALGRSLERRAENRDREADRLERLFEYERRLWGEDKRLVAGVDEVGAGPLAGPVVAGAVVFEPGIRINKIDDSKRLDRGTRERLDREIRAAAAAIGVGVVSAREIDGTDILRAALKAMKLAVDALGLEPEHVLVDARTIPDLLCPQTPVVKGDARVFSIAAASVVAKVFRDRLMDEYAERYPGYGFESNRGYGSREHLEAIARLGPCPIHRMSFAPLRRDREDQLALEFP